MGEKERYTHLNADFQRTARRDMKAFLSDHCKEIEENNRMGKTRGLFKKIRDTKGTFHAKMGSIKDRLSSGHRTGKAQFSFQFQRKAMPKDAQTTTQLHSSHTLVK